MVLVWEETFLFFPHQIIKIFFVFKYRIMQGWLFLFEKEFWRQPQVQALVTSIPLGKMLILDLFSETNPIYSLYNGYYGQPFIWCMLHNFGGTHGMYGSLNRINEVESIYSFHYTHLFTL